MINLIGGELNQWDLGRRVATETKINELHFAHKGDIDALVMEAVLVDGAYTAEIPNELLQSEKPIYVYAVKSTGEGKETVESRTLPVKKRERPSDYIYSQTDVKSYAALEEIIRNVDKDVNQLLGDISAVLDHIIALQEELIGS